MTTAGHPLPSSGAVIETSTKVSSNTAAVGRKAQERPTSAPAVGRKVQERPTSAPAHPQKEWLTEMATPKARPPDTSSVFIPHPPGALEGTRPPIIGRRQSALSKRSPARPVATRPQSASSVRTRRPSADCSKDALNVRPKSSTAAAQPERLISTGPKSVSSDFKQAKADRPKSAPSMRSVSKGAAQQESASKELDIVPNGAFVAIREAAVRASASSMQSRRPQSAGGSQLTSNSGTRPSSAASVRPASASFARSAAPGISSSISSDELEQATGVGVVKQTTGEPGNHIMPVFKSRAERGPRPDSAHGVRHQNLGSDAAVHQPRLHASGSPYQSPIRNGKTVPEMVEAGNDKTGSPKMGSSKRSSSGSPFSNRTSLRWTVVGNQFREPAPHFIADGQGLNVFTSMARNPEDTMATSAAIDASPTGEDSVIVETTETCDSRK